MKVDPELQKVIEDAPINTVHLINRLLLHVQPFESQDLMVKIT